MTMHRFSALAAITLLLLANPPTAEAARASVAIRNIEPTAHDARSGATLEEIGAALAVAAEEFKWDVQSAGEGRLRASLVVRRKHHSIVEIGYDARNFWITYQDSKNLNYHPPGDVIRRGKRVKKSAEPRIHPNYNVWVRALADHLSLGINEIISENRLAAEQANAELIAVEKDNLAIADELQKLDALRTKGILTDAEFESQKSKLLSR